MKKTLYLHIGRPKTGSTALQTFLHRNRDALEQQGICYPKTGLYQKASHKLSLVLLPELPDYGAVEEESCEQLYDDLVSEARNSSAPAVVVSSENFWLVDPGRLPAALKDNFDVKVVAYLRRQDDVLVSSFMQEVKGGAIPFEYPLDDFIANPTRRKFLDYHAILQAWAETFGRENVIVRLFEQLDKSNGIERDFLKVTGVADAGGLHFPATDKNISPSIDVIRILSELHPLALDGVSRRRLAKTFSKVESALDHANTTPASALFSSEQRRGILEHFAAGNDAVCHDFLPDWGHPLFPPLTEPGIAPPDKGLQTKQSLRLLTGVVALQQRQIVLLQNRMDRIEKNVQTDGASREGIETKNQHAAVRSTGGLRAWLIKLIAGKPTPKN